MPPEPLFQQRDSHTQGEGLNLTLCFLGRAQYALRHQDALAAHPGLDLSLLWGASTIAHFDATVVCKIFGYATIQHYNTGAM